jgi:hypothetical protein
MAGKKTLGTDDISTERTVSRRSAMGLLGAGAVGAAVMAVGLSAPSTAEAQCSDRDPSDPAGRGRCCRGISDSDPSDGAGCGRRSCSDSDPSDGAGLGRRC